MKKIALLVLCLIATPAFAAWAHVRTDSVDPSTTTGFSTTIALTMGANTQEDSILVCAVTYHETNTPVISGIADSLSNTYAIRNSKRTVSSLWSLEVWSAANSPAGANTITVTFSASTQLRTIACSEYSGIATSSEIDATAGNTQVAPGTGTDAVTSTSLTTTQANDLVYGAALAVCGLGTFNSGTGLTSRAGPLFDGAFKCLRIEDLNQAGAGSVAATWTNTDAGASNSAIAVAFKEASAGGGGAPTGSMMMTGVGR
jgi:hypothetical protein